MTTNPLTDAELAALEAEHTPAVVPPCKVCGAALKPSESDYRGTFYNCSTVTLEALTAIVSSAESFEARTHWSMSRWHQPRTDPRILRLVAEVRELRGETL